MPSQSKITIGDRGRAQSASWISGRAHPNRIRTSKYNVLNFVPLNLYHQLSKYSTAFFFVTLLLLCIPPISPFSPWPYLLAFLIVVGVSMVKDGIEDYKRHVSDRRINMQPCRVVGRDGAVAEKCVMDLDAGEFLLVEKHEEIPADAIILRGRNKLGCTGYCFVDTANLDGESNLKKRVSPLSLKYECDRRSGAHKGSDKEAYDEKKQCPCFMHAGGCVKAFTLEDTGDTFSDFCCRLELDGKSRGDAASGSAKEPCGLVSDANEDCVVAASKNVMLRGSLLRNTDLAVCLVVAVGPNTKQGKSSLQIRKGKSLFEKKMDHILLIVAVIYAVMLISTTAVGAYMSYSNSNVQYINNYSRVGEVVKLLFSNYILYSYLVPLSLYVMIEVTRLIHASYIKYDRDMKVDGHKSICRNSNVIEDLGMIDYVLTDKTGTLTKNSMTLKHFHVSSSPDLVSSHEALTQYAPGQDSAVARDFQLLLMNILVCNSIEVLNGNYEGISQDELCFLKMLKEHGYELLERDEEFVRIKMGDEEMRLDILHTVEFSSKRQSMSIVAKLGDRHLFFAKGSDQRLLDREAHGDTLRLLSKLCDYRVLVLVAKELTGEEAAEVLRLKRKSSATAEDGTLDTVDGFIRDATYLGATLIEDELQDDVRQTVEMMRAAGIKIWMITGDKRETALSCARNCGIIDGQTAYREMDGREVLEQLKEQSRAPSRWSLFSGLGRAREEDDDSGEAAQRSEARAGPGYISPDSVESISSPTSSPTNSPASSSNNTAESSMENSAENASDEPLFDCNSVIIYRTTPSQKGRIAAQMAKAGLCTLSIGDGNNDVEMLKDANVGVGIIGKEGTQASLAADFAIPCFRVLQHLLFIHGRYNLMRYAKVAINAYYKNLVFIFIQYFYNFYNAASGKSIYDSFFLNYYNLFFTSLIPFSIALFDRDIPASKILADTSTYKNGRVLFCKQFIWANIAFSIIESAAIFFTMYAFVAADISGGAGLLGGFAGISTLFSIIVFVAVILRQIRIVSYAVVYTYIAIGLSIAFKLVMLFGLAEIGPQNNSTIYHVLSLPIAYVILCGVLSMVYSLDTVFSAVGNKILEINCYRQETGKA
ncbi:phospholipid-translocating ATPase [Pancytospora philotis]|nr:phospholipid-translocating ATPase [Pancytospora philotis]